MTQRVGIFWLLKPAFWMSCGVITIMACSGSSKDESEDWSGSFGDEEVFTVVEVETVELGSVAARLTTHAMVESEYSAGVVAGATGVVLSVHAGEGDVVDKGDLLAVIENASLDAAAERAQADLERLGEQYSQVQSLHGQGAVSNKELQEAEYQFRTAKASAVEADKTQGHTRITAPFDGVVGARDIRVGEMATGSTRAFQIVDLTRLRVVATLPERDLTSISVGQTVVLRAAYNPEVSAHGYVDRIAPVVDPTSGTVRTIIAINPSQTQLRPGQFVSIEIEVERRDGTLVIPRRAVMYEEGRPIVYRRILLTEEELEERANKENEEGDGKKDGKDWGHGKKTWGHGKKKAKSKGSSFWKKWFSSDEEDAEKDDKAEPHPYVARHTPVTLGILETERVEVLEGLETGEEIVVVGQSNLKDDTTIKTPAEIAEEEALEAARKAEEEAAAEAEGSPPSEAEGDQE